MVLPKFQREGEKMTSVGISLTILVVAVLVAYATGRTHGKAAAAPAPAPQPKIFGLCEFENFVGAIPTSAKSDPATLNVVIQAGTGLAVGLLGFEDRVVPEAEEAIAKKTIAIRKNDERVAELKEEISEIQMAISETEDESDAAQRRIATLAELKTLKAS